MSGFVFSLVLRFQDLEFRAYDLGLWVQHPGVQTLTPLVLPEGTGCMGALSSCSPAAPSVPSSGSKTTYCPFRGRISNC